MSTNYWQKIGLFFLMLVIPFFLLKEHKQLTAKKQIKCVSNNLDIPSSPQVSDKSFVVVIPAFNTLDYYEKNLTSVLDQIYPNFRIVYIDQGSTDGSLQKVREFLSNHEGEKSIEIIEAKDNENPFIRYYQVIHSCNDDEIIIHLDGNDWLAHEKVISMLNRVYASDDVWLTYGQYLEYPSYKKGIGKQLTNRALTKSKLLKVPWIISHLKTYYASLFKQIKIEDCMSAGEFPTMDEVTPFVLPMIQRAKKHVRFIPEVLYVHNSNALINKDVKLGSFPEALKKPLEERKICEAKPKADVVVFSKNHPTYLSLCLQSIYHHMSDVDQIIVVHESNDFEMLKEQYPDVRFLHRNEYQQLEFKSFIIHGVLDRVSNSSYVVLTTDNVVMQNPVALSKCIGALKKTSAYGFYLHMGKRISNPMRDELIAPRCKLIGSGIYSWKISSSTGSWSNPDTLQMALYDRSSLKRDFQDLSFNDTDSLINAWAQQTKSWDRLGLFYDQANLFTLNH